MAAINPTTDELLERAEKITRVSQLSPLLVRFILVLDRHATEIADMRVDIQDLEAAIINGSNPSNPGTPERVIEQPEKQEPSDFMQAVVWCRDKILAPLLVSLISVIALILYFASIGVIPKP